MNQLESRQHAQWPLRSRIVAGLVFTVGAGAPYLLSNQHPIGAGLTMAWSVIDGWVPFLPALAWVYVSLYGLLAWPLLTARSRQEGWRYVAAGVTVALAGALCLAWQPTLVQRPVAPAGSLLALVQRWDAPLNACPSLHAALVVVALLALKGQRHARIAWVWGAAIVASAALVKQHAVIDLWFGAALGLVAVAAVLPLGRGAVQGVAPPADEANRAVARELAARMGIDAGAFRVHGPLAALPLIAVPLAWLGGVWLIAQGGVAMTLLGTVIAAFALNALFLIIHEAVHQTLPMPRVLGHGLASVIGLIGFASHASYRLMHLRHHRHLGGSGDPDDYRNWTASPRRQAVMHHLRLAFATLSYLIAVPILAWREASQGERRWILFELAAMIVLHTLGAWWLGVLWWQMILPPLLLANVLINARGLVQHTACVGEDPLRASRSVRAGRLVRALLLNENYHLEHHLFPAVPAGRLHDLHLAIAPALGASPSAGSYHAFVWRFIAANARGHHGPLL